MLGTVHTAEQVLGLHCFADEKTKGAHLSDLPKHTQCTQHQARGLRSLAPGWAWKEE